MATVEVVAMKRIFKTQFNYYYFLHAVSRMTGRGPNSSRLRSDNACGFSLRNSWSNNTGDNYAHSWSWSTERPLSMHKT